MTRAGSTGGLALDLIITGRANASGDNLIKELLSKWRIGRSEMNKANHRISARLAAWLVAVAIVAMPIASLAQTQISYHSNKYKPSDDVKLGRQAAAEAEQQFPLLRDSQVQNYVESVGQRLVAAIPPEFQHT